MKNNSNNLSMALDSAFKSVKEVIGVLQLDPDYDVQTNTLAEVLEFLRVVDREIGIALLREADIARAEYRKDHGLPAPDLGAATTYKSN